MKTEFRRHPLAIAIAVAAGLCAMPQAVAEQQAPAAEASAAKEKDIEVIQVTGSFRDSLSNALNVKRQSDSA